MNEFGLTPLEDFLDAGIGEVSYVSWALESVRESGRTSPEEAREAALELIQYALREGLIIVGDVRNAEFIPWECGAEEAISRIRHEWIGRWGYETPTPGAIAWCINTQKGDEIAAAAVSREKRRRQREGHE